MNRLRQILREQAPELHEALERSWRIATEEWLGTLKPSKGSYNAYPHLHNLEHYLEQALSGVTIAGQKSPSGHLSMPELYVLLSAILLHDIGRGRGTGDNHPGGSQKIVVKNYAHLNIPSRELAKSIGGIAATHGYSPLELGKSEPLPTIVVDPYGQIRQGSLAALLRLVDHMDSAYTRVVPEYVVPEDELEILGRFRNVVLGVVVDHDAHLVRTVISLERFKAEKKRAGKKRDAVYLMVHPYEEACRTDWKIIRQGRELPPDIRANPKTSKAGERALSADVAKAIKRAQMKMRKKHPEASKDKRWHAFLRRFNRRACRILTYQSRLKNRLSEYVLSGKANLSHEDWLVARRFFQVDPDLYTPPHALLAVLMGDVLANARELAASKSELASIGLPLAAWLVDCEGHLYNTWGEETYEPIFTKQFLERIAKGMWELSTRVFGFSLFTCVDLAAYVGESDVMKVYRAIRRISIVTQQCETIDDRRAPAVWIGAHDWRWNVSHPHKQGGERCSFVHIDVACRAIKALGDPRDERV